METTMETRDREPEEKRTHVPLRMWWEATRPRMFPVWLASGIIPGAVAWIDGVFDLPTMLIETLLCYLLLSLSCWADEYGDYEKGVDNEDRLGPIRPVQRGAIPMPQMKRGCIALAGVSFLVGCALVAYSCLRIRTPIWVPLAFVAFGIFCILCAFGYTMGKRPYGYHGWGDFASWFFFGPVAGIGGFWLYAHTMDWTVLLPMSGAGILLALTINLQNVRDFDNDEAHGKRSTAVCLGRSRAIVYHYVLTTAGCLCYLLFPLVNGMANPLNYVFAIGFIPLVSHCLNFRRITASDESPKVLDTLMWPLTKAMCLVAVLFCVGILF